MKYDAEQNALGFKSQDEVEEFHRELSVLVRSAMINATRHIEDPQKAKEVSRGVMKDLRAVVRALNALRTSLPRRSF
ncbi:MAG: hypothetical protein R3B13_00700 [Polyangiaceae bacterium]